MHGSEKNMWVDVTCADTEVESAFIDEQTVYTAHTDLQ